MGQILAVVLRSAMQDLPRFPRGQDFVAYCRRVKCAKESQGKRLGPAGKKIGTVHLRGACAAAAGLFIRQSQPGKESFAQLEHQHGNAKALTVRAHQVGRAVYFRLTREQAFDRNRLVTASPRRGEPEPVASRATKGKSLRDVPSVAILHAGKNGVFAKS